jgi:hypothetical protein
VNSRLRVPALVGVCVLVLGAGFIFLRGGSSSSATSVHTIKPLHPVTKNARLRARKALAPPRLALTPKRQPDVIDGVPTPLHVQLSRHAVVVLVLAAPQSDVDKLTIAEAKAGAAAAGVGFATINVAQNAQVAALSALVGSSANPQDRLLDAPAVLVFQRPTTLYVRLNGYSDADTIRQAAVNAEPAPGF